MRARKIAFWGSIMVFIFIILFAMSCQVMPTEAAGALPNYVSANDITYGPISGSELGKIYKRLATFPDTFYTPVKECKVDTLKSSVVRDKFPEIFSLMDSLEGLGYVRDGVFYSGGLKGCWYSGEIKLGAVAFKNESDKYAPHLLLLFGYGFSDKAYTIISPITPDENSFYIMLGKYKGNGKFEFHPWKDILIIPENSNGTHIMTMPSAVGWFIGLAGGIVTPWVWEHMYCPECRNAMDRYSASVGVLSSELSMLSSAADEYADCCSSSILASESGILAGDFESLNEALYRLLAIGNPCGEDEDCNALYNRFRTICSEAHNLSNVAATDFSYAQNVCSNCWSDYGDLQEYSTFIRIHSPDIH